MSNNNHALLQAMAIACDNNGNYVNTAITPAPAAVRLSVLSTETIVLVQGPDAASFLQGQLSCDVADANHDHSCLGSHNSPKGRMISNFRLLELQGDSYALAMHASLKAIAEKALGKYIVFSKADISDGDPHWVRLGIAGDGAAELLAKGGNTIPEEQNGVCHFDDGLIVQVNESATSFEIWLNNSNATQTREFVESLLQAGAVLSTPDDWQLQLIRAGIGQLTASTSEQFLPQMLNLQVLGGISFSKGCYTGQEVIARMHYRGQLKRRMYRVKCHSEQYFEPNTPIFVENNTQSIGNLVSSAKAENGQTEALIVATAAIQDSGASLGTEDGPQLATESLPYAINNED